MEDNQKGEGGVNKNNIPLMPKPRLKKPKAPEKMDISGEKNDR